ncbi:MarR family winged helix-turn-helix transcriptional regulator [Companilactobacillus keshanensis]|uniref:MarR family winged helix-turn-helix transcriptional regulator n=1 Tax=Companilactobacillus keshanensis TaxID=2486003 RepID=A0ABW4BUH3_9LACO|nr:helix-turn-helix domain-containing protein [Companilactobacillus keshanensis]
MLSQKEINEIRSFNRKYTDRLGLLNKQVFNTDFSFQESRVLLEIGSHDELTPMEVANNLDMDASYTSRIINKLVKLNLVTKHDSKKDARSKFLLLTKAGQNLFDQIDDDSNKQIQQLVANISVNQQERLYKSLTTAYDILFENESED